MLSGALALLWLQLVVTGYERCIARHASDVGVAVYGCESHLKAFFLKFKEYFSQI
jgi:hypothetical protein